MKKIILKKQLLTGFLGLAILGAQAQQKIKDGTGTPVTSLPAAGSILELQSTQAGLRMPQIALTNTTTWLPLVGSGAAATSPGMSVYNTNAGIASTNTNYPALGIGEYYWDGTGWVVKNPVATAAYIEPWYNVATNTGATSNIQNIYQMGTVGIGTTTPGYAFDPFSSTIKLDVFGAVRAGGNTGFPGFFPVLANNSPSFYPVFISHRSRGTLAAPTYVLDGDILGSIAFRNHNSKGPQITASATEDHSVATAGSELNFWTVNNGANLATAKMTIAANGFVGIGTNTPLSLLHISDVSNTTATIIARFQRVGTGAAGLGMFLTHGLVANQYNGITNTGDAALLFDIDGDPVTNSATEGLVIAPWSSGATSGIKITETGNVGIGIAVPGYLLHVAGAIKAVSGIYTGLLYNGTASIDGAEMTSTATDAYLAVQRDAGSNLYLTKTTAAVGTPFQTFSVNGSGVGTITRTAGGVAYNTTSDIRLKENINATHYGVADVMKITVADYNYKTDKTKTSTTGFLAQDLYKVYPDAVTPGGIDEKTNPWQVEYGKITPLLVKAIQDQQAQIEKQQAINERQQDFIEKLQARLKVLEDRK